MGGALVEVRGAGALVEGLWSRGGGVGGEGAG